MRREKIRYNGLDLEKGSNEKAVNRMEEERDLVVFSDEEGTCWLDVWHLTGRCNGILVEKGMLSVIAMELNLYK